MVGVLADRYREPVRCRGRMGSRYRLPVLQAARNRAMSTTQALIERIKAQLKSAGLSYAALARELGMAESSIKRMFARGEMPLSRVDEICRVLKTDFAELARQVAEAKPQRRELTLEQERAVVSDRKLLLMAICCLSQWTFEQIVATYTLSPAECIKYLVQLDRPRRDRVAAA